MPPIRLHLKTTTTIENVGNEEERKTTQPISCPLAASSRVQPRSDGRFWRLLWVICPEMNIPSRRGFFCCFGFCFDCWRSQWSSCISVQSIATTPSSRLTRACQTPSRSPLAPSTVVYLYQVLNQRRFEESMPISKDVLPVIIFSVAKFKPPRLVSNLLFTRRFRNPSVGGEA